MGKDEEKGFRLLICQCDRCKTVSSDARSLIIGCAKCGSAFKPRTIVDLIMAEQ